MQFFKRLILLSSLVFASSLSAATSLEALKARGSLKIGMEPGFLPFEMRTPKDEWVGFDVEMMRAFAQSLGVKAEFVSTKWDGIIPGLMAGKYDLIVSGMTITEERAQAVLFSEPYYQAGLKLLLAKKHSGKVKSWKELDAKGKIILVKLGTTGDIFASKTFKQAEIRRMDSEADAAQSVALGRGDAFVYDRPFVEIFASSRSGKVSAGDEVLSEEHFGVAAQKKSGELIQAFNAFLKTWRQSGAYDKAYQANFKDLTWKKQFPEELQ